VGQIEKVRQNFVDISFLYIFEEILIYFYIHLKFLL